jgi:hypothetical protein
MSLSPKKAKDSKVFSGTREIAIPPTIEWCSAIRYHSSCSGYYRLLSEAEKQPDSGLFALHSYNPIIAGP